MSKLDDITAEFSDDVGYILLDKVQREWSNTRADELQARREDEYKQQIKALMLDIYKKAEASEFDTRGEFFQKVENL